MSCLLYGIRRFPHFRGLDCTQTYVNTVGTNEVSAFQISSVSVRWGYTVQYTIILVVHADYATMTSVSGTEKKYSVKITS